MMKFDLTICVAGVTIPLEELGEVQIEVLFILALRTPWNRRGSLQSHLKLPQVKIPGRLFAFRRVIEKAII